jgi:3-dehydroquinate dehydratase I
MRPQSEVQISVRNRIIGGPDLLICLPLMAAGQSELLRMAQACLGLKPDLLEWRLDAFDQAENVDHSLRTLDELRTTIGNLPLIFTCRNHLEGGRAKLTPAQRQALITAAIQSGNIDIIDIELSNDDSFIQDIRKTATASDVQMILSYHDFDATPEAALIIDTLFQARDLGADIVKVAVMPQDFRDVLILMEATLKARQNGLKIPMISISMGTVGSLTRLACGLFGSDITFASGDTPSAPGQIPIQTLRQAMAVFYT